MSLGPGWRRRRQRLCTHGNGSVFPTTIVLRAHAMKRDPKSPFFSRCPYLGCRMTCVSCFPFLNNGSLIKRGGRVLLFLLCPTLTPSPLAAIRKVPLCCCLFSDLEQDFLFFYSLASPPLLNGPPLPLPNVCVGCCSETGHSLPASLAREARVMGFYILAVKEGVSLLMSISVVSLPHHQEREGQNCAFLGGCCSSLRSNLHLTNLLNLERSFLVSEKMAH